MIESHISSIIRTPVEIWDRILEFAIACPLLPSEDDGLVECHHLLQRDCENLLNYLQSERFRLSTMLVCKTWKAILDRYSNRLQFQFDHPAPTQFGEIIQCYDAWEGWACCPPSFCQPCLSLAKVRDRPPPGGAIAQDVRAYIDGHGHSDMLFPEIGALFPELRVLSVSGNGNAPYNAHSHALLPDPLSRLSEQCPRLTHLLLQTFGPLSFYDEQVLILPDLRTLVLDLSSAETTPNWEKAHAPFSKWVLPRLRNLLVSGRRVYRGQEPYVEIEKLIQNTGRTLKDLSLALSGVTGEIELPVDLWKWCPQLTALEISSKNLYEVLPPPKNHKKLRLLLLDNANLAYAFDFSQQEDFFGKLHLWMSSVRRFGMSVSWKRFHQDLRRRGHSRLPHWPGFYLQLLDELRACGYHFEDRDGVCSDEEGAEEAINLLREMDDTEARKVTWS